MHGLPGWTILPIQLNPDEPKQSDSTQGMATHQIAAYVRKGKNKIEGWLARSDAEIMYALLGHQSNTGMSGSVVEIGVHHGKSFILLALCNRGRDCYAIDVFGDQALNVDMSGKGDKAIFLANLTSSGIDQGNIVIDERLSFEVTAGDIVSKVGKTRFFHIDGGHHLEAVRNDLELADQSLADFGIIAVDDVFRPEWPEVSIGTLQHAYREPRSLVPFAIGFNKTYLCRPAYAGEYRSAICQSDFLQMYISKTYEASADEFLVLQRYPLPEWGLAPRLFNYLATYHPDLAFRIWNLRKRSGN